MLRVFVRLVISILLMVVVEAIGLKDSGRASQNPGPRG